MPKSISIQQGERFRRLDGYSGVFLSTRTQANASSALRWPRPGNRSSPITPQTFIGLLLSLRLPHLKTTLPKSQSITIGWYAENRFETSKQSPASPKHPPLAQIASEEQLTKKQKSDTKCGIRYFSLSGRISDRLCKRRWQ